MSKDMKLIMENFRQHVKEQDELVTEIPDPNKYPDPDAGKSPEDCVRDYLRDKGISILEPAVPALAQAVDTYASVDRYRPIGGGRCSTTYYVLDKFKRALMRGLEVATAAIMAAAARASMRFEEGQQNLQTERMIPAGRKLDEIKEAAFNLEADMMQALEDAARADISIPGADIVKKNWETFHTSLKEINI